MRWRLLITISLLCFCLNSCKRSGGNSNSSDIVLGEYASKTGTTASFGLSSHEGSVLAMDEINSQGGILGNRAALTKLGVQVMTSDEAVALVERRLRERDEMARLVAQHLRVKRQTSVRALAFDARRANGCGRTEYLLNRRWSRA